MNELDPAELLRRAHCAHNDSKDPEHACIGQCTITRKGIYLDCMLCGDARHTIDSHVHFHRLTALLQCINIDITYVDTAAVRKMLEIFDEK